MELKIEYNSNFVRGRDSLAGGKILITPPLDEDYWIMRVPLSDNQSVVAFPKFMTIGIGFQYEEDWNTNLPFQLCAKKIFSHIEDNKGDDSISDDDCIKAIMLLQNEIINKDIMSEVYGKGAK